MGEVSIEIALSFCLCMDIFTYQNLWIRFLVVDKINIDLVMPNVHYTLGCEY